MNRFARNGVTREILDSTRLTKLFKYPVSLEPDGRSLPLSEERRQHLQSLVRRIRGDPGTSTPGYCNILATLLHIRCLDQTLHLFEQNLYNEEQHSILNDDDLPFQKSECVKLFGESDGQFFWINQFLFCAVRFKEGDQVSWVEKREPCRLPFVCEPTEIGRGTFGVVRRAIIETGHLINKDNEAPLQVGRFQLPRLPPTNRLFYRKRHTPSRSLRYAARRA